MLQTNRPAVGKVKQGGGGHYRLRSEKRWEKGEIRVTLQKWQRQPQQQLIRRSAADRTHIAVCTNFLISSHLIPASSKVAVEVLLDGHTYPLSCQRKSAPKECIHSLHHHHHHRHRHIDLKASSSFLFN